MFHKVNLVIIRNKISEVNCGKNAKCRKYILNIKSTYNQLPTIFFPRSKTSRSGAYFVPETGRLVAKFPATMTICTPRATAFVRKTDENFTNWSKKFEPAAEGRRIFFNVQHCLSRIFGTAKWRLAHNSDQEPMLPKSHTPQDNVIVWQICLFISLKIVKTQRLMRSVSNGRNRVKFTQSVRQKQWSVSEPPKSSGHFGRAGR